MPRSTALLIAARRQAIAARTVRRSTLDRWAGPRATGPRRPMARSADWRSFRLHRSDVLHTTAEAMDEQLGGRHRCCHVAQMIERFGQLVMLIDHDTAMRAGPPSVHL